MGLTIRDAESSYLTGRAIVQEWQAEFIQAWLQPETDLMLVMFWENMDPLMKAYLKTGNPDGYARMNDLVKQAKERNSNVQL